MTKQARTKETGGGDLFPGGVTEEGGGLSGGVEKRALQVHQAASLIRLTPWTIALNILASVLLYLLGREYLPAGRLYLWVAVNIGASLIILTHWGLAARRCRSRRCAVAYIGSVQIQGFLLGVIWASLPLTFFESAPTDLRIFILVITIGAFSLGSFRMAPVPLAALFYILLPAFSVSWMSLKLAAPVNYALSVLTFVYALALAGIVMVRYREALNNSRNIAELNQRKKIIELLLRDFEKGASDWLWETSPEGALIYASGRLAELTGKMPEELMGRPFHKALGNDEPVGEWRAVYREMLAGRTIPGVSAPAFLGGRERRLRLTARPFFDAEGRLLHYRGVASDITEQYLHEERLRREKAAAERESQAKSNFLAVISHELRTPLNAMVGFSELLVNETFGPLNEKYRDFCVHIHDSSRQLERLINDILDYTRFERNKIKLVEQEVDLAELADMTLRQVSRDARAEGLKLRMGASEGILVRADLGRLKQVLSNLLVNAVKFTSEGSVTVDVVRTPEGGARVSVADTGVGISREDMEKIFQPFSQADSTLSRRQDGIGLGLSIARSLIRLHGGELTLESAPGEGCVASFTLPPERVIHDDEDKGSLAA